MDISFCIPVYNCGNYLESCFDSIIRAIHIGKCTAEIIAVDDCSNDNSFQVLQRIQDDNPDVGIILLRNEINKGVSFSRNRAMEQAKGKYLWFVDADDMIVPDALSIMLSVANDNGLSWVVGNYKKVDAEQKAPVFYGKKSYKVIHNDHDFIENYAVDENGDICNGASCGIYNREFLQRFKITFDERLSYCEDIMFNFDITLYVDKIAKLDYSVYNYRFNPTSTTKQQSSSHRQYQVQRFLDLYYVLDEYLSEGRYNPPWKCNNRETLLIKQIQVKQSIVRVLAEVDDSKYVKQELCKLKQSRLYPYPFQTGLLENRSFNIKKLVLFLLPIEPVFWMLHLSFKLARVFRGK